jgi:hypothetical protein
MSTIWMAIDWSDSDMSMRRGCGLIFPIDWSCADGTDNIIKFIKMRTTFCEDLFNGLFAFMMTFLTRGCETTTEHSVNTPACVIKTDKLFLALGTLVLFFKGARFLYYTATMLCCKPDVPDGLLDRYCCCCWVCGDDANKDDAPPMPSHNVSTINPVFAT